MEAPTDASIAEAAATHERVLDTNEQAKKQCEGLLKHFAKQEEKQRS